MTVCDSLELFVQRQGDLRRHVDEALAQEQSHRLAGVAEDLLQLLRDAGGAVLLTVVHDQILHLLHALDALHTHTHTDTDTRVSGVKSSMNEWRLLSAYSITRLSYLSLGEVQHTDEAKHFVWVVISVAVLGHLCLLNRMNRQYEI